MPEIGNPNFFKTFKNKYTITLPDNTTDTVMLSCTNDIIFLHRLTSNNSQLLATFPNELRPTNNLLIPCYYDNALLGWVRLQPDGKLVSNAANKVYYLEGLSFNISSKYYG